MIGSPAIKTAVLHLENGRTLTIEARGQGKNNVYVSKVVLNGRELNRDFLTYSDITAGGKVVFFMSDRHN